MFQNHCFALCQGSSAYLGDTTHFNLKVQVNPTWTAFGRPKFDEKGASYPPSLLCRKAIGVWLDEGTFWDIF